MSPLYFDHNATTPVDSRVLERMLPFFRESFGNASSVHRWGRAAAMVVNDAREALAEFVGARPSSLVWTSGSTESLNMVLHGLATQASSRRRVLYSATEHKAVLETVGRLAERGMVEAIEVPVASDGHMSKDALAAVLDSRTLAVCVMSANNETGVLSDVAAIAELAHAQGALMVCDATQHPGKLPLSVRDLGADYVAISAHKCYGPQGVGALVAQPSLPTPRPSPLIYGGGHQDGLRAGTLNVPGIVGFGAAAEVASEETVAESQRLAALRDRLEQLLKKEAGPITIHSKDAPRLPNTTNVRLHGVDADALIVNCPDVAFSSGSACTSSVPTPSHVLTAMGIPPREAEESIRLSLGRFTTEAEIDEAAELIGAAAARIREVNS